MIYILYYFIISIVIFSIYIEITPGLSNIWYRVNSKGNKVICINYLISYILEPFHNKILWTYKLWDINSIIFISTLMILLYLTNYIIKFIINKNKNHKE